MCNRAFGLAYLAGLWAYLTFGNADKLTFKSVSICNVIANVKRVSRHNLMLVFVLC